MKGRLLTAILMSLGAGSAQALEQMAGVRVGQDSNPAQTRDGTPLAFADLAARLTHRQQLGGADLALGLAAAYRDYAGDNDNHRLTLEGGWSGLAEASGLAWNLALDGGVYRDRLVPADERDEVGIALDGEGLLGGGARLAAAVTLRRLDFRNDAVPWEGRPMTSPRDAPRSGPRSGQGPQHPPERPARTDRLFALTATPKLFLTPTLDLGVALSLADNDSSHPIEGYREGGAALRLEYAPAPAWELVGRAGGQWRDYAHAPHGGQREDHRRHLGFGVRWHRGDLELRFDLDRLDNDSTLAAESFRQTVGSLGLWWAPR
jgi:hypothetical protein